jgi:hypothetical protein
MRFRLLERGEIIFHKLLMSLLNYVTTLLLVYIDRKKNLTNLVQE